jgi:hypothetical protein
MVLTNRELQQRIVNLSNDAEPLKVLIGWLDADFGNSINSVADTNRPMIFEWVD